jgi:hypothetical protein
MNKQQEKALANIKTDLIKVAANILTVCKIPQDIEDFTFQKTTGIKDRRMIVRMGEEQKAFQQEKVREIKAVVRKIEALASLSKPTKSDVLSGVIDRLNNEIKERDRIILQDLDSARKGIKGKSQKANEENVILTKARAILQAR